MAIPAFIVIRATIEQLPKDYTIASDPATILPGEMAIVINSSKFREKTQTCVGVLTKCRDQMLSTLKEYRGFTYYAVQRRLSDGGDLGINDGTIVNSDYAAVIVGNLFGQNSTYGIGAGANLGQLSHDIDRQFKDLIDVLLQQDVSVVA